MLQKFLFVGVGGSGGVTVRALRERLIDHLAERGYDGGIPAAWQFVHIDVPLEQDRKPERIPLLPDSAYVGLAVGRLQYRDIDAMMTGHSSAVVQHTAVWRPNPNQVHVAPESGGGRFRAVGRVVLGARMAAAHERLRSAVNAMNGEAANEEFSRVCRALTGEATPNALDTQVVVFSSLAGGSGSGLFGDVCDMIRQLVRDFEERGVAILYTPQVFDELSPSDRAGINPNALAMVCELLNGHWNKEPAGPNEFAFLKAAGAEAMDDVQSRGPRINYMIGRSNGLVSYSNQTEVYETVARGVSVWTTSAPIQDRFAAQEVGNWAARALGTDRTGLTEENAELPLSSFGCASVGIGLERFARYSIDRLAREAVEHVLSGHWRVEDEQRISEEEARRQRVEVATRRFLGDCGLDEKGPRNNDVIDAMRGGLTADQARDSLRSLIRPELLTKVRAAWPPRTKPDLVARIVVERMTDRWTSDFTACEERYLEATGKWAEQLQELIQERTANLVAHVGGKVVLDVLRAVITELTEVIVPELQTEMDLHKRTVEEMRTRVSAALAGAAANLPASHPQVEQAVDAAIDCFHSRTEELIRSLAIDLVEDLAANLLTPLADAVRAGLEGLHLDRTGSPERSSPIPGWPTDSDLVPDSYQPAKNELVLESVANYPAEFARLLLAQADDKLFGNALARARQDIITGISDREAKDQRAISSRTRWVPRDARLRLAQTPSAARFQTHLGVTALRDRTRAWVRRPDTPMARHLEQTLQNYLADHGRRQEQQTRLDNFRAGLAQAVRLSAPLITIDAPTLMRVHNRAVGEREVMTPLPFPEGHPARGVARRVFASRSDADFEQLLGPLDVERIDIFTFLDQPVQPAVMSSLTFPISAQWQRERLRPGMDGFWTWRRARQLPWFVPCTPRIRRNIVRGWFVARYLNQIRCAAGDLRSAPTEVWDPEHGYTEFPSPLLGGKIRKLDEWLPAVLETMALTVVGASVTPYLRLAQLGESLDQAELGSRSELTAWLEDGAVAPDAPVPDPQQAGRPGDAVDRRVAAAHDYVQKFEEHYRGYCVDLRTPEQGLAISRAWEIRYDVLAALDAFRRVVDEAGGDAMDVVAGVG